MQCPKCGEELPEGARFCFTCGTSIDDDVPAPKKLEEPLDPSLAAGAVPMVPVGPPPRAMRMTPRAPRPYVARSASNGSWQPARSHHEVSHDEALERARAAEKDARLVRERLDRAASDRPAGEVDPDATVAADVSEFSLDEGATGRIDTEGAPASDAWVSSSELESRPAGEPHEPAAAAAVERLQERGHEFTERLSHVKPSHGVIAGVCVVIAAVLVFVLVQASAGWFSPFADRTNDAPQVQPPSDGSIDPIQGQGSDDEASSEEDALPEGAPEVRAAVEDYSWEELSQLSALIAAASDDNKALDLAKEYHLCTSTGELDGTQTKDVKLSGGTTVTMRVAGFRQDKKADGSGAAGISFIAENAAGTQAMDAGGQTAGGWEESTLRTWMGKELMAELPSELSDAIVAVEKHTNPSPSAGTSAQQVTEDKLWLPSYSEVVGDLSGTGASRAAAYQQEGEQYQLFADAGVTAGGSFGMLATGSQDLWWMRSPDVSDPIRFMCVSAAGETGWSYRAATPNDVLMGFCL